MQYFSSETQLGKGKGIVWLVLILLLAPALWLFDIEKSRHVDDGIKLYQWLQLKVWGSITVRS